MINAQKILFKFDLHRSILDSNDEDSHINAFDFKHQLDRCKGELQFLNATYLKILSNPSNQRVRIYALRNFENCPTEEDAPVKVFFDKLEPGADAVNISGFMLVKAPETNYPEVTLVLQTTRCSLDLKRCASYQTFNFRDFCTMLKNVNTVYGVVFKALKPKFECGEAGNYTIENFTLDLMPLRILPLEGYIFILTFKLVGIDKVKKKRKTILCEIFECQITRGHVRN